MSSRGNISSKNTCVGAYSWPASNGMERMCQCHKINKFPRTVLFQIPLCNELPTYCTVQLNTLRPRQNGRYFADDIFKGIFFNENARISLKISLKFVPKVRINNILALVQIMAWRRPGDKPLSEPMLFSLLTHICVSRPQWVNVCLPVPCCYTFTNSYGFHKDTTYSDSFWTSFNVIVITTTSWPRKDTY